MAVPDSIAPGLVLSSQTEAIACESGLPVELSHSNPFSSARNNSHRFVPKIAGATPTQIRLRLGVPQPHQQERIISQLVSAHGISVTQVGTRLELKGDHREWFDLELKGTPGQLQAGLAYLLELDITIKGKASPSCDGWHC